MTAMALTAVSDAQAFGGKAASLGAALRAGLPVPDGVAISWDTVEAIVEGEGEPALRDLPEAAYAVRSSAVGEDSSGASFAGAHLSVLGVRGADAIAQAITQVNSSGSTPSALAYRSELRLGRSVRMGVVVQHLVDADVSGVMFTRHPLTGADERVVEASWGLGEAVVSGLVTPDSFVMDAHGMRTQMTLGEKDLAIRARPAGIVQESVDDGTAVIPCLSDRELAMLHQLALDCDRVYGPRGHDIEFAFGGGLLWLLQRRPITQHSATRR